MFWNASKNVEIDQTGYLDPDTYIVLKRLPNMVPPDLIVSRNKDQKSCYSAKAEVGKKEDEPRQVQHHGNTIYHSPIAK